MKTKIKIEHHKDYYIWSMNYSNKKLCLAVTNLDQCDYCGKPSTVNCVWITGGATQEMIQQANFIKENYGELTELGADSEGNCFCESCYNDNAVLEE